MRLGQGCHIYQPVLEKQKDVMTIDSVEFLSVDEASAFIPCCRTVAISLLSPKCVPVQLHNSIEEVLRLYFHDLVPVDKSFVPEGYFSIAQAQQIIEFIRKHHASAESCHMLIHCEAGISRSAAVAVFAASECGIPLSGQFAFLNPWVLATLVKTSYPHYAFD